MHTRKVIEVRTLLYTLLCLYLFASMALSCEYRRWHGCKTVETHTKVQVDTKKLTTALFKRLLGYLKTKTTTKKSKRMVDKANEEAIANFPVDSKVLTGKTRLQLTDKTFSEKNPVNNMDATENERIKLRDESKNGLISRQMGSGNNGRVLQDIITTNQHENEIGYKRRIANAADIISDFKNENAKGKVESEQSTIKGIIKLVNTMTDDTLSELTDDLQNVVQDMTVRQSANSMKHLDTLSMQPEVVSKEFKIIDKHSDNSRQPDNTPLPDNIKHHGITRKHGIISAKVWRSYRIKQILDELKNT